MDIRIGLGTDLHRLENNTPFMLGGVYIPFDKGAKGHSDGDVLIHALCDALLGALALRDIGHHFPDTDPQHKGAASSKFLMHIMKMVTELGWKPVNVDAVIHLEFPKLSPHIEDIRSSISTLLNIETSCVSVKAKTAEKTGEVGQGRAVEALVVCLLKKSEP